MSDDASNKPHPASPKRREEYRKEGKFPKARDTTVIAVSLAVVAVVAAGHGALGAVLDEVFVRCHGDLSAIARGDGGTIAAWLPKALAAVAVPPAVAAALAGVIAGGQQSGWRLYPEMLKPKFDKLNPLPKIKEMANPKTATFELLLAVGRVGTVGYVCYHQLESDIPTLLGLTGAPITMSLAVMGGMMLRMTLEALGVLVILAVADFLYNRYTLEKQMRMSDQDIKDEAKQADQDPALKGKMRQKMREASKQRIISAVGDADVIITNPSHYAVALRYADSDPAPLVLAKGTDALALRIRAEARKHGIPIMESRRLARALHAEVEMGHPIPGQHYIAVAKILAFVFQLKGRRKAA